MVTIIMTATGESLLTIDFVPRNPSDVLDIAMAMAKESPRRGVFEPLLKAWATEAHTAKWDKRLLNLRGETLGMVDATLNGVSYAVYVCPTPKWMIHEVENGSAHRTFQENYRRVREFLEDTSLPPSHLFD